MIEKPYRYIYIAIVPSDIPLHHILREIRMAGDDFPYKMYTVKYYFLNIGHIISATYNGGNNYSIPC